ncbi:hypothetical protein [Vibrio sp.]|uniref:hypothetical protein n=1 Tax=Vibrio sp. TaxID=678 RepID=UPI003797584B
MPKYKFELTLDVDEPVFLSNQKTELATSVVIDNLLQSMSKEDLDYLLRLTVSSHQVELGLREIQE